jgi:hypothetical protein
VSMESYTPEDEEREERQLARIAELEHIIGKQEEELHQGELRVAELEAELSKSEQLCKSAEAALDSMYERTLQNDLILLSLEQTKIVLICRSCSRHNTISLAKTVDAARSVYKDEEEP